MPHNLILARVPEIQNSCISLHLSGDHSSDALFSFIPPSLDAPSCTSCVMGRLGLRLKGCWEVKASNGTLEKGSEELLFFEARTG